MIVVVRPDLLCCEATLKAVSSMEIEWRVIAANTDYEVSNDGQIRRATPARNTAPGRLVKPRIDPYGYKRVTLCGPDLTRKLWGVHRLVALAFLPQIEGFDCVHHRNHVKTDNHVSNLEWCTRGMNTSYAIAAGITPKFDRVGAANGNAKLDEDDVRTLRGLNANGYTATRLAQMFGITKTHACDIINRKSWAHVD